MRRAYVGCITRERSVLDVLGRYSGPAVLVLSSLADGEKHAYALVKDVERFTSVRIPPGTLYEVLRRLEIVQLIEPVPSSDRRRPYRLTELGRSMLATYTEELRRAPLTRRHPRRDWAVT